MCFLERNPLINQGVPEFLRGRGGGGHVVEAPHACMHVDPLSWNKNNKARTARSKFLRKLWSWLFLLGASLPTTQQMGFCQIREPPKMVGVSLVSNRNNRGGNLKKSRPHMSVLQNETIETAMPRGVLTPKWCCIAPLRNYCAASVVNTIVRSL